NNRIGEVRQAGAQPVEPGCGGPDLVLPGQRPSKTAGATAMGAGLRAPSIEEAARRVGLGEKTLRRWLRAPDFAAELQEAQRRACGASLGPLRAEPPEARRGRPPRATAAILCESTNDGRMPASPVVDCFEPMHARSSRSWLPSVAREACWYRTGTR